MLQTQIGVDEYEALEDWATQTFAAADAALAQFREMRDDDAAKTAWESASRAGIGGCSRWRCSGWRCSWSRSLLMSAGGRLTRTLQSCHSRRTLGSARRCGGTRFGLCTADHTLSWFRAYHENSGFMEIWWTGARVAGWWTLVALAAGGYMIHVNAPLPPVEASERPDRFGELTTFWRWAGCR